MSFSQATTPRKFYRVFFVDITCLLCNRLVGTAQDSRWPPIRSVLFRRKGSSDFQQVMLNVLRCPDCRGNTTVSDITSKIVRLETPRDLQRDPPRRGRPPNWLVAERASKTT